MNKQNKLALFGGSPSISVDLEDYIAIQEDDISVATSVLKSGKLSQFVGAKGEYFLGGPYVRSLESSWGRSFGTDFSVSCNSWTSGLWLAIGALDIEPGSEVIVSSWTMAATATTILHWNLVPVFADVDPNSFNLDPVDVERRITPRTRAIVSPDIFGQSADIESLKAICSKYDLRLVSDTAQSPGATRNGYLAGTASDIGGFSLNYHKHIHSGEGGVAVTNSANLAERMQLLRNHGEVVVGDLADPDAYFGILGMNLRMGEVEAAIAENQLRKLAPAIQSRRLAADYFSELISKLPGLKTPAVTPGNEHVYYVYGIKIDSELLEVSSKEIVDALRAEGVPAIQAGYQNVHKLPLFSKQLTYRKNPLPYSLLSKKRQKELTNIHLPVSERLHKNEFIGINWCAKNFSNSDIELLAEAFTKVWSNLSELSNR